MMHELITLTAALTAFYLIAMIFSAAILKAEKVWTKIKRGKMIKTKTIKTDKAEILVLGGLPEDARIALPDNVT